MLYEVITDYLGLNNVRLGYTLPSKFTDKLQLSKFNLFVSGDNLLFFSKRKGFNVITSYSIHYTKLYDNFPELASF